MTRTHMQSICLSWGGEREKQFQKPARQQKSANEDHSFIYHTTYTLHLQMKQKLIGAHPGAEVSTWRSTSGYLLSISISQVKWMNNFLGQGQRTYRALVTNLVPRHVTNLILNIRLCHHSMHSNHAHTSLHTLNWPQVN